MSSGQFPCEAFLPFLSFEYEKVYIAKSFFHALAFSLVKSEQSQRRNKGEANSFRQDVGNANFISFWISHWH